MDHLTPSDGPFLDNAQIRLICIADAHQQHFDAHGGTDGYCAECGWAHPCPTRVWATTDRTFLDPWNPIDDEPAETPAD